MPPLLRHTLDHLLKNFRIGIPVTIVIGFAFLLLNLILFTNQVGKSFLTLMKGSLSFTVYVEETIDPFTLRGLIETLEQLKAVSPPVVYLSPEEARVKFNVPKSATNFPGSLTITPKEPELRKDIQQFLEKSAYRPFLSFPAIGDSVEEKTYEKVTAQIARLQKLIQGIMYGLVAFSLITIVTVIFASLTLGSLSRRKELTIMKLVGASPAFLEFPYLLEAMAYSVFGLLAGTVFFLLLPSLGLFPADEFLQKEWATFPLGSVFALELLLTLLLAFIAGSLSIRKILKKSM